MAVRYENNCVDCPPSMGGCMNCGRKHEPVCSCDRCGDELPPEALYEYDGKMLCGFCLLLNYQTVAQLGIDYFE